MDSIVSNPEEIQKIQQQGTLVEDVASQPRNQGTRTDFFSNVGAGIDEMQAGIEKAGADALEQLGYSPYAAKMRQWSEENKNDASGVAANSLLTGAAREIARQSATIGASIINPGVGAAVSTATEYGTNRLAGADASLDTLAGSAVQGVANTLPVTKGSSLASMATRGAVAGGAEQAGRDYAQTGEIDADNIADAAKFGTLGEVGMGKAGNAIGSVAENVTVPSRFRNTFHPEQALSEGDMAKVSGYAAADKADAPELEQRFGSTYSPDAIDYSIDPRLQNEARDRHILGNERSEPDSPAIEGMKETQQKEAFADTVGRDASGNVKSQGDLKIEARDSILKDIDNANVSKNDMYNNISEEAKRGIQVPIKPTVVNQFNQRLNQIERNYGSNIPNLNSLKKKMNDISLAQSRGTMADMEDAYKQLNRMIGSTNDASLKNTLNTIKSDFKKVIEDRNSYAPTRTPTASADVDAAMSAFKERNDIFSKRYAELGKSDIQGISHNEFADKIVAETADPSRVFKDKTFWQHASTDTMDKLVKTHLGENRLDPNNVYKSKESVEGLRNMSASINDAMQELNKLADEFEATGGDLRTKESKKMRTQSSELQKQLDDIELYKKQVDRISRGSPTRAANITGGNPDVLTVAQGGIVSQTLRSVNDIIKYGKLLRDNVDPAAVSKRQMKRLDGFLEEADKAAGKASQAAQSGNSAKAKEEMNKAWFATRMAAIQPMIDGEVKKGEEQLNRPEPMKTPEVAEQNNVPKSVVRPSAMANKVTPMVRPTPLN